MHIAGYKYQAEVHRSGMEGNRHAKVFGISSLFCSMPPDLNIPLQIVWRSGTSTRVRFTKGIICRIVLELGLGALLVVFYLLFVVFMFGG